MIAQGDRCSFPGYDLSPLRDCSVAVEARLADSRDVEGTVRDDPVGQRDWASVCTVRDCLAAQVDLAGYHSQGIDLVANSFLANTEIGAGMGPFCKHHAVVCVAEAVLCSLALVAVHFVDLDLSFLREVRPDLNPD